MNDSNHPVAIIPAPVHLEVASAWFRLTPDVTILAGEPFLPTARYLADAIFSLMRFRLEVRGPESLPAAQSFLQFSTGDASLGDEGYELEVEPTRISIRAAKPAGAFYACQTLRQLWPSDSGANPSAAGLPGLKIQDQPRFPWRGLMLDPARHFLSKDFIKRYIDLLAFYKLNRLHLHLTDNEAWTIEIKRYPQLTEIDRWIWKADAPGARGIYSQEDIREIVAYATDRQVMVIPEIEMPAHSINAQLALRDLLCPNNPWRKARPDWKQWPELDPGCTTWPDPNLIAAEYCMGNEKTFEFLEDVLREVMDLFPSPWIHIGGDEYLGNTWSHCPLCQKRQATLGREDSPEIAARHRHGRGDPKKYLLYRYGMRRMAKYVVAQGRIPILWDTQAWGGRYPEGTVVHQWHTSGEMDAYEQIEVAENPILDALEHGHDVINSSCSHLYFDYDLQKTPLAKVYEFEPVPPQVPEDQKKQILGAHAPVWAQPQDQVDRQAFPRLLALAERSWSPADFRDFPELHRRLENHQVRLSHWGISFSLPPRS